MGIDKSKDDNEEKFKSLIENIDLEEINLENEEALDKTKELFRNTIDFFSVQQKHRNKNREKTKQVYGKMAYGHMVCLGAINSLIKRYNSKPGKTNEKITNSLSLLSSFLQSIDICEVTITESTYVQATALLKQEMEIISAFEEIWKDKREDGITPNVSHLEFGLNELYGDINDIAHTGKQKILNDFYQVDFQTGNKINPTSITPVFDKKLARRLYGLHLALMIQGALCLDQLFKEMYDDGFTKEEYIFISYAGETLVKEGWLVSEEEKNKNPKWPEPK
ncbi:hypothetical protein HSACCH_01052 [Halanaerobium saccharolyticum subsp. saccharolyticum DSM 6643]|uniref:Uncharacterized protein n=1 Tax=Halanaerobium saccharolyticum subsp. saccharolyticum DSM 6643 TaxID=1293054 RepID=M5E0J4_9FIRM|nr:hypothetical protein [Halanaerobium saccharolyticum]CCU79046.1 hypothetical protein HSACCH_01052 [Halanaerobium saccharolyticum subsp. saccharolyticum DSM 6643]